MRAASKVYIAGSIGSLGSDYVLGLKAVNCQTGDALAQEQVTVASKEKVLNAMGEAAYRLRGKLGEPLPSIEEFDRPLQQVTTSRGLLASPTMFYAGNAGRDRGLFWSS